MITDHYNTINKMLEMQEQLDLDILKAHNLRRISTKQYNMAILDEIGELVHELKGNWCWWKFTQPEVDQEKVLGELVDVWHFVLSYYGSNNGYELLGYDDPDERKASYFKTLFLECDANAQAITTIVTSIDPIEKILSSIELTKALGFTMDNIYEAYSKKNKVNHERVEQGY